MKKDGTDLRIYKTNKALFEAMYNLLGKMPFEEIKVSDICKKAIINRSTFYSHYNDKYELINAMIIDLKNSLSEELTKNTSINNAKEYYMALIKLLLNHIEEKKNLYQSIMFNNKYSITIDMVYNTAIDDVKSHLEHKNNLNNIPPEIISNFYLGAVISLGMIYLRDESNYTKDEIINYLDKLIPDNLYLQ